MSENTELYVPLNQSGTDISGSAYIYNIPVALDKYVDANTYLNTGYTTGPFVLESTTHVRGDFTDYSVEHFVQLSNRSRTTKEKLSLLNHFYRYILPYLRDDKYKKEDESLQQFSLLLSCSDERISNCAIQFMHNLVFKVDFEKLNTKTILKALKETARHLAIVKDDSRDETVRMLTDLTISLLLKENSNPVELKEIKRGLSEVHQDISKASKKDKALVYKNSAAFLKQCIKHTMSKEGSKLLEGWDESTISETDVQMLISSIHVISFAEIYLHLLGLIFKLKTSTMPISIAMSFAKIAHSKLSHCSPSKDKRSDISLTFLADFIIRGVIFLFDRKYMSCNSANAMGILIEATKIVCSPDSSYLAMPSEVMKICSKIDQKDTNSIWSNLCLSNMQYQDLVLKHVKSQIPGLVVKDSSNQKVGFIARRSDHCAWVSMLGTFMNSYELEVKLMVPGQHPTKLDVSHTEEIEFSDTESEFEILRYIQRNQQHINVAQMVAFYDTNPRSVAMFAVERYEVSLLKYLYDVRSRNDELTMGWKLQRCMEMLSAIDFIHHHNIVHREIMAMSFSVRCQGLEHEIAVLTSFKRAIYNDVDGGTSMIGHVRDLNATQIPTRWSAPESFLQNKFDRKSDIWMFGHAVREVFTYGCQPYTEIYSEDTGNIMVKCGTIKMFPAIECFEWIKGDPDDNRNSTHNRVPLKCHN